MGAARAHTRGESGEGGHERGRPAGGGRSTAVAPDRRPSPPTPDQAHGTPPGFPHIDPARRTTRRLLPTAPSTPTTAGSGHAARRGHNPGGKRAAAGGAAASRGPPPGHASPGRGPARDSASARAAPTGRRPGSPAGTEGWARTPDARWRPGRRGSPAGTTAVAAGGTAARPTAFRIRAPPTRTDRDRHGTGPRTPPPRTTQATPRPRAARGISPRGTAAATALSASSPLSRSRGRRRPPPRHRPPFSHTSPRPTRATAGRTRRGEAGVGRPAAGTGHGAEEATVSALRGTEGPAAEPTPPHPGTGPRAGEARAPAEQALRGKPPAAPPRGARDPQGSD